ncbi:HYDROXYPROLINE-RICH GLYCOPROTEIN-LIKE [Salix purpurea]|uniref:HYDROXYPROLINE-RICH GLYCOPROTEIN-LIKE n=1 Tax=Salix purpurea TaxID=77065 RepID=A0A9Q0THG1_SALPP|nr:HYDROXYPROLINE-RICH GLYCOPROTEIN-LIKE [Salix purpurea]
MTPQFQAVGISEKSNGESAISLPASAPESSSDDASGGKQVELLDDQARNYGSDSPAASLESEHPLPVKSSSPLNLDNYADIGLVRNSSPSYAPSESQQQQDHLELPSFSTYDPQTAYDISYLRGQGLPSPHEVFTAHTATNIPASTMPTVQQQPPMAQMYPQVHVSQFSNLVPYRQFISPVYVPPMPMPGYSNSPAYPHPSNGNSYLLMPGGGSHLNANGLKYGIQHYKPVPGNNPAGFANFVSPSGYAINAPGVVGSATGLEDSSRMKYKDGNLYVPNPQAEASEIWIQNPREMPGLQSAPYYNMPGQTHAAYLPSHAGHASFNAAAAQSSHMQFPGLYPPTPQPTAMASPHHLGPVMGGNVGVAPSAPGAQVGAYQQPQLGHLNWTTNF